MYVQLYTLKQQVNDLCHRRLIMYVYSNYHLLTYGLYLLAGPAIAAGEQRYEAPGLHDRPIENSTHKLYQFCNFKHFLKAENSEDSVASSRGQFVCRVLYKSVKPAQYYDETGHPGLFLARKIS